jgi:glutathione S-transferase
MPARGADRRQAWQIISLASGAIEKAGAVVYERALRPADKQFEPWVERCALQRDTALAALEALPQSPWLVGSRLTQADITTACLVGYLKLRTPEALAGGRCPKLEALSARAEALPAFQAARPAADEVMPAPPAS